MSDQTYELIYKSDNSDAVNKTNAFVAALRRLDQLADQLLKKVPKIFSGVGRSAGTASKGYADVAASLQSVNTQATSAGAAVQGLGTSLRGATTPAGSLGASLGRIGGAAVGLAAVRAAVHALADGLKEARDYAKETAEANIALRDAVRELQAIKGTNPATGKPYTTTETTEAVTSLMVATGMKEQEAIGFDEMFGSTIGAAQKSGNWKLSDAQTEEVKGVAAAWAVANGIAPEVVGKLVPSIGIGMPVGSVDDVLSQMAGMHAMGVDAVGKFTPVMKAESKLAGNMVRSEGGGAFRSPAELMAGIGATTSVGVPEARSVQSMSQVWRELVVAKNDTQAATFKALGIVPGTDDYESSVRKIGGLLASERARGVPEPQALKNAGFNNGGANAQIINAVRALPVLQANLKKVGPASDPDRIREQVARFKADNPARFADAALFAAEQERGAENRPLEELRRFALAGGIRAGTQRTATTRVIDGLTPGIAGDLEQQRSDRDIRARIAARVPRLAPKNFEVQGTDGDDIRRKLKQMTPAERAAVFADLEAYAQTGRFGGGGGVPAGARAAVPRGADAAAAFGAPGARAGGGAGGASLAEQVLKEILGEQKKLNRQVGANRAARPAPAPAAPLPSDVDTGGARRAGG